MRISAEPNCFFRLFEYRSPRQRARFPLWIQTQDLGNNLIPAVCNDISESGLGAELDPCLQVGAQVLLVIPTASCPVPYKIHARVVSQHEQRHGFVFLASKQEINEILSAIADSQATAWQGLREKAV